jgi:guanosine-3',5'-bis(diphosphate) 3'-pyrophosphohydrolase
MMDHEGLDHEFTKLIEKISKYDPNPDIELIKKAYMLSKQAHEGQVRYSGEPFFTHAISVAHILADMEMDSASIAAGILHDTIEDTDYTGEKLEQDFGSEVANLVYGVTKLSKLHINSKQERQVYNFRKMLLAMANDVRVILIKLADRLHNMRTLDYVPKEDAIAKAKETIDIYAPLAGRLGIYFIKWELEDLSLRYLDYPSYQMLKTEISQRRQERIAYIEKICAAIKAKLSEIGMEAIVEGRPKHFYSIYSKMKTQNKTLDQIYDLFAVRVIVNTEEECYHVLGLVHEMWKPVPGRVKDYIAMPKENMYQSLHTTLMGDQGIPFEVQIRTKEMHKVAEYGIAAHWAYKKNNFGNELDEKLSWLRQLLEWQNEVNDADEFMESLKINLVSNEVFVFTPKGDLLALPAGSTPIDFAYNIHSAIGNKMVGAKVNGKIVPLGYELKNGDIVNILTSPSARGPSRDWLSIVKSPQARSKINQFLKKQNREENIARGKEIVERDLKKQGFTYDQLFRTEWLKSLLKKYNFNTIDDFYASVGFGGFNPGKMINGLKEEYKKTLSLEELADPKFQTHKDGKAQKKKKINETGILVKGIDNCLVRLSRCCNPVPGDSIIGYVTQGRGVSVHRTDCINLSALPDKENKLIEVEWISAGNLVYEGDIAIRAYDRPALLVEVADTIGEEHLSIQSLNARTTKDNIAIINMTIRITDTDQLETIIRRISKIQGVFEVSRKKQ